MKYYSRSPKEFQNHFDKNEKESVKKRRRGHLILFLDILVILLILLYFFNSKINLSEKNSNEPSLNHEKSFEWQGWQITTDCPEKKVCALSLKNQNSTEKISYIYWALRENKQPEAVFQKKDIVEDKPEQKIQLSLPFDLKENHSVFLLFYNSEKEEILKFRAYP
ncbi:MAG: hypothetical protein OEZ13_03155 [Spirochaetia bacterium]|nr:hypothetical protein [Spirochaetia bacterium]